MASADEYTGPKYGTLTAPNLSATPYHHVKPLPKPQGVAKTVTRKYTAAAPTAKPDPMAEYLNAYNSAYTAITGWLEQQNASLDAAIEVNKNELQKQKIDALREIYIGRERTKTRLPQQNAAMGNTGGLSESSLVGMNAGYETNRQNTISQFAAKLQQLMNDIEVQKRKNAEVAFSKQMSLQNGYLSRL